MIRRFSIFTLLIALGLMACSGGEQNLVGNWNIKIQVGNVGEGIRSVILEIKDLEGELSARMSKLNGRMDDVDEVKLEDGNLFLAMGSYEYNLKFDGDTIKGKVVSPAGEQEVTGTRQESLRVLGDEVEPLRRSWRGTLADKDGEIILKTRRGFDTQFTNAEEFKDQLEEHAGKSVEVTGWWMKTKIKIQKIEDRSTS